MSELFVSNGDKIEKLRLFFISLLEAGNPSHVVRENMSLIESCTAYDVIVLVDSLVKMDIPVEELKKGINRFLNLVYTSISTDPKIIKPKNRYLECLMENNKILGNKLQRIKALVREINKNPDDFQLKNNILEQYRELDKYNVYYEIKENILFPVIEKYVTESRCLRIMWSFHDDIRNNLKASIRHLEQSDFDLKGFNRHIGDLFFNMYVIIFREEKILFPFIEDMIPSEVLNSLFKESNELGFPYYQPDINDFAGNSEIVSKDEIDLETGILTIEQIKLLFNHLPVDITYVDENNRVKYFSTTPHRIFRRTKSVIGRDVHNCHPQDSVHAVMQIVDAFKRGEKNTASFWIDIKDKKILIQYFAVRDSAGRYKGVLEVSQEISEIQSLKGEKRLLDWD